MNGREQAEDWDLSLARKMQLGIRPALSYYALVGRHLHLSWRVCGDLLVVNIPAKYF